MTLFVPCMCVPLRSFLINIFYPLKVVAPRYPMVPSTLSDPASLQKGLLYCSTIYFLLSQIDSFLITLPLIQIGKGDSVLLH